MQLERVMSMMRYWPAKGTAGFARSRVRGKSRSPAPPARRTPSVSLIIRQPQYQTLSPDRWTAQLPSSDAQKQFETQRIDGLSRRCHGVTAERARVLFV